METTPGKRLYDNPSPSLVDDEEHSDDDEHSDTIDVRKSGVVAVEALLLFVDDESRRWYDDANDDNSRLYDELF